MVIFVLAIILDAWLAANYFAYFTGSEEVTAIFGRGSFLVGALIVPAFIVFSVYFPYKTKFRLIYKILVIGPPIVIVWMSTQNFFLKDQIISEDGFGTPIYGDQHYIFSLYILLYLFIAFWELGKKYTRSRPIERVKLRYIIIGFAAASFIGVLADLVMPYVIENSRSYWGSLGTILISISFAYAILRYRLLDIRIVIREGFVHFITLAIVLSLYVYLLFLSRDFVTGEYGWDEQTTTIALVLIIAITFEPLRRIVFRFIHSIFVSREKNAKDEVKRMRLLLSTNVQFDSLIEKSLGSLQSFFSVKNGNFMYRDPATQQMKSVDTAGPRLDASGTTYNHLVHQPEILVTEEIPYRLEEVAGDERARLEKIQGELQKVGIGMVVPIGEPGELFGLFVFGQKEKSEAYTADNIQYIKSLQPQMTGAIANALMYKQAMERISRK